MSGDISTLRADHGNATAFRIEARHEFVEVLVRNPCVRSKVAPVVLDPGKHQSSWWTETEPHVAGDERRDTLAELVGEGCHGGVPAGRRVAGIGIEPPPKGAVSVSPSCRVPVPDKARSRECNDSQNKIWRKVANRGHRRLGDNKLSQSMRIVDV